MASAGARVAVRLHDVVAEAAARAPDRVAITDGSASLTFAELDHRAASLASVLRTVCSAGDRVAVVADNCVDYVRLSYATSAGGLVLAPLNARSTVPVHVALVEDAGSVVLAGQPAYLAPLRDSLDEGRMPSVRALLELPVEGMLGEDAALEPRDTGPVPGRDDAWAPHRDLAWLLATSGTTGRAKGVQLTHAGLLAAARSTLVERPVTEDDVFLTCFSLCHVAAYNVLVAHLAACEVVLRPRFEAADAVATVERCGVTMASLAPTMIVSLLGHLESHPSSQASLRTLRAVAYGSSAIGPALLRRTLDELGVDLYQGYGMTEASGNVAFLGPAEHRLAVGAAPGLLTACGSPSPDIEVRLLDGSGEIAIRGPQVTPGYWRDDDATGAAFVDGWYRTGDVGRFDDEGYLHIVDRLKDIVVTGGENVSSRQVEEALAQLESVSAVGVTGVPDERWGEAVCACVEVADGAPFDAESVRAQARALLPGFAVPKHVFRIVALPRTSTGKVRKDELRRWAAAQLPSADRP
jgi:acyl-CoA synthetase (AMP-forming)/AMP-acid ligase II